MEIFVKFIISKIVVSQLSDEQIHSIFHQTNDSVGSSETVTEADYKKCLPGICLCHMITSHYQQFIVSTALNFLSEEYVCSVHVASIIIEH